MSDTTRLAVLYFAQPSFRVSMEYPAEFVEVIQARCRRLISLGIWDGLSLTHLEAWISNFHSEHECLLAACLLDNLAFRSKSQTLALLTYLFEYTLPNCAISHSLSTLPSTDWLALLQADSINIRLFPVADNNSPTSSSNYILRLLSRELLVPQQYILNLDQLAEYLSTSNPFPLFLDDIIGSGEQFADSFYSPLVKRFPVLSKIPIIYASLAAYCDGMHRIVDTHMNVIPCTVDHLDHAHQIFGDGSDYFQSFERYGFDFNTALSTYKTLAECFGFDFEQPHYYGFHNIGLSYIFDHGIADCCLPIFWYPNNGWNPLKARLVQ